MSKSFLVFNVPFRFLQFRLQMTKDGSLVEFGYATREIVAAKGGGVSFVLDKFLPGPNQKLA